MEEITTISSAQEFLRTFVVERNWLDFPNIDKIDHLQEELGEILSPFQGNDSIEDVLKRKDEIVDGVGDLYFALCRLSNQLGVNLEEAFETAAKTEYGSLQYDRTIRSSQQYVKQHDIPTLECLERVLLRNFVLVHNSLSQLSKPIRYQEQEQREAIVHEKHIEYVEAMGMLYINVCRLENSLNIDVQDAFNVVCERIVKKYPPGMTECKL